MNTAFIYDTEVVRHHTGPHHPEHSERITSVLSNLQKCDWFETLHRPKVIQKSIDHLYSVHDPSYVQRVLSACESEKRFVDTPDVAVCRESFDIGLLSASIALNLVDVVFDGSCKNGFALTRPPGHHAEQSQAMGFCLFNNVAIAAKYAQQKHKLSRVAIVDWDVHHGNGTQQSFYEDPSVFYISLHQFPFYPGTGRKNEVGTGKGRGTTLNLPLPAGCEDAHYRDVFETLLLPALNQFKPEAIFISAGFDAHEKDPLGGMRLSTELFSWMTYQLMLVAQTHGNNRVLSFLEGGYDLQALSDCIQTHVLTLAS